MFLRRQRILSDPLIDLRLFRSRSFNAALTANTLSIAIVFGIDLFIAQYLQLVLGLSPLQAGLWTAPAAGGFIAGSMLAPLLVRYVRPAFVVAGGLVLAAVGLGLLAQVDGDSPLALIVICSIVIALGVAPPVTLGTDLIVSCVRPERAGVASGLSETGAELGGALGIALLGSIGVAVYRSQVADALPIGLAPGQADAAEETLAGAREVVQGLEGVRGTALLESAQEAFAQGMRVAALIAAAVALGTALLAAIFLRQRGTRPPPDRRRAPEAELAIEV